MGSWNGPSMSMPEAPVPAERGGTGMTAAFIVFAVITALAVWVSRDRDQYLDRLQAEGRTVTGRVTDVTWQQSNLRNPTSRSYFVHYDYVVDGTRFSWNNYASKERALRTRVGDPISVTYHPSDPQRACTSLAEERSRAAGSGTHGVAVLGFAWVAVFGMYGWRRMRSL